MLLLVEGERAHSFVFFVFAEQSHAKSVNRVGVGSGQMQCFLHYRIRLGLASHGVQHCGFGGERREIFVSDCGPAERAVYRLVSPDQSFLEIDLVVRAELRGGLPVLIVEPRP